MTVSSDLARLAPFRLEPIFTERVWGSRDLRPRYDRVQAPSAQPIGEVWLTGDHCRVLSGPLQGKTLAEVFDNHTEAMLGSVPPAASGSLSGFSSSAAPSQSPLLIKVIFAQEKLSVQVHPDDRLAQKYGQPRGKTECWYALSAEPGAEVAAGLKDGVTLAEVERGVADGTLEESLAVLPVTAGDMIFVDAGTVHAIWPGSVLLETQQNCDVTYRLYDYGRPRELHVARALEAIRTETAAGKVPPLVAEDRTVLIDQAYFRVEKMLVDKVRNGVSMSLSEEPAPGLAYLFAAAGRGHISPVHRGDFEPLELPGGSVIAVPATSPDWQIADGGGLELIRITPRWPTSRDIHER